MVDRRGIERVRTSSRGVAITAARRVLIEQGEVWLRASDDTCAHFDPHRVATDTPSCSWVPQRTVAAYRDHLRRADDYHRAIHQARARQAVVHRRGPGAGQGEADG